ncbi:MAG TPA: hypothetical protein VJP79_08545 [Nitrososphaera sp.]|nr:hypothetical protein [Nitrososphaera sp.]
MHKTYSIKDPLEKGMVRSVKQIANSEMGIEGEGFLVHRSFPTRHLPDLDPFLLLDEMGPMELSPGEA